jgi:hypothetical protein
MARERRGLTMMFSLFTFLWRDLHASPPCLGKTDSDRLFSGTGAVLSTPNVIHFFFHKGTRLVEGDFPARLSARAFFKVLFSGMANSLNK